MPALASFASRPPRVGVADPLVHTFSIVARDPQTGDMGVAVQSHWFSVGSIVTWAEAGVGAVATQSFVDPAYGLKGLGLMRGGASAPDALKQLVKEDPQPDGRQVAMIDTQGRVDAYTGKSAVAAAGHIVGEQFSAQANMMANDKVWPAMAEAYRRTKGDLADRLLAALDAAQAAGGDARGRQSAAIIVVKAKGTGRPWVGADRIFDLRVEDNPQPLVELRRLLRLQRAYGHANRGDELMTEKRVEDALTEYAAASKLAPEIRGTAVLARRHAGVDRPGSRGGADFQGGVREGAALAGDADAPARRGVVPDDAALIARIRALR